MAELIDSNNPSFILLPVNNNRTAWRPFGLPVVMVVPHKRDASGLALPNSSIFSIRVYIEDVPQEARVAGHQNIGRRFPNKELYAETIDSIELADRMIDLSNVTITRNGIEVSLEEAENGDLINYTTSTGIRDTIPFLIGADYYDLSDVLIDVELLPSDRYNLVYEAEYFKRIVSLDGRNDFLCVDSNTKGLAVLKFQIDHPGRVIDEFYRLTPPPYLTSASKAKDTTVALYRPFTDLLQDVMDEQALLERINWVFDAPAEAIPYLSSLLGWDIPYFPESLDQLRRAVLRRTVEFQNLKGSRRAIISIFRLFGFEVLISNLWWSEDGKRLIRPDERLPLNYQHQEITTDGIDQVDAIIANHEISNFSTLDIPLLFRPQEKTGLDQFTALRDSGQITVTFYVVQPNTPAHQALENVVTAISTDPAGYGASADCRTDSEGFFYPNAITEALEGKQISGYSQIRIAGKLGDPADEIVVGPIVPVRSTGISLNRENNSLKLTFNGFSELIGYRIYGFATYRRFEFRVPDVLQNLQSNRFDLQVLTQALDEFADPVTLEFAVEFLYKLKAFHSLLNVIRTRIELTETYGVTDLCVGGDFEQRYDTDIGRLQVPPAIIPQIPSDLNDCSKLDAKSLGYKDSDILLRLRQLANLPDEHEAWKILDNRDATKPANNRITPNQPSNRDACIYNPYGQDRKTIDSRTEAWDTQTGPSPLANSGATGFSKSHELSPQDELDQSTSTNSDSSAYGSFIREYTEIPEAFCDLDRVTDYCYKGRVGDELLYRPTFIGQEPGGIRPVHVGLGVGVYWLYPALTKTSVTGVRKKDNRSQTNKMRFSGGAPEASQYYYQSGIQKEYLDQPYDLKQNNNKLSFLGRLYRDYGTPTTETLHYSNRPGSPIIDQRKQLALQRPSLEITKSTMHLPGCRFPMLNRLKNDFESEYEARPWDVEVCGPQNICGRTDPTYLNFKMVIGTDGNEYLSYDEAKFTVIGNNLEADIPSLGEQTLTTDNQFTDSDVVHKVYLGDADDNPAVELDGVVGYGSSIVNGTIDTQDPLFSSHNVCATDPTQFTDYADGYPAVVGFQDYEFPLATPYDSLLGEMGLPAVPVSGQQVLFLLSSGIRDGSKCFRFDGGCLLVDCEPTNGLATICATDSYLNEDGDLDFDPDHLKVEARLVAIESLAAELTLLNGQIPTLLETI